MLAFIGMPGPTELIILAMIVLLLFGKRLPGAMRSLGQSITEFKKGAAGIDEEQDTGSSEPSDRSAAPHA